MEQQEALLDDGSPSPRPPTPILVNGDGASGEGDSSSAGSVLPVDAVSAQLINNITMLDYHSLGKTTTLIQEELGNVDSKATSPNGDKLPHFVSWNWPLIRKVLFWGVLSVLFGCVAIVVAMVATLPRTCNPVLPWYQGQLFYEVFPASFKDSNGDGIGDLKGLVSKLDYIENLGVRVLRLNSIFKATNYPEQFNNVTTLTKIDESIGTLSDFAGLIQNVHNRNMTLVLDLPVYPFVTQLKHVHPEPVNDEIEKNKSAMNVLKDKVLLQTLENTVTSAIRYWATNGVDGFYLKGIEHLIEDPNFSSSIKSWKKIIGEDKILMISHETLMNADKSARNTIMYNVDLIDVFIDATNGSRHIKSQIESITNGSLWSKPGYPWVHWSVGNVNVRRLSSKVTPNNTLSAILMTMMLPGTPSIFYGDEISLQEVSDAEDDFHESKYIHNLTPMRYAESTEQFTKGIVHPWITGPIQDDLTFGHIRAIRQLANVRSLSPAVYLNSIWRDGIPLQNTLVRDTDPTLIIERWYPRKNSFAYISNIGNERTVADLSSWFYGGYVVVSSNPRLQGDDMTTKSLTLNPYEVIILELKK